MSKFEIKSGLIYKGRRYLRPANRIESLVEVGPGRFEGRANGSAFRIEGGKARGGSANEWFLDWEGFLSCPCSGPIDALNLIETC